MNLQEKILITGSHSRVALDLQELLIEKGYQNVILSGRDDADLTNQQEVKSFFHVHKPNIVIHAAARTSEPKNRSSLPWDIFRDNLLMQCNVFEFCVQQNIRKVIWISSDSALPNAQDNQLQTEDDLFSGLPTGARECYSLAKMIGAKMCEYIHKQCKDMQWIVLFPSYIYGNIPKGLLYEIVKEFIIAKRQDKKEVVIWGSRKLQYWFLHSRDLASAIYFLLNNNTKYNQYIIAPSNPVTKEYLAAMIADCVDYHGTVIFDENKTVPPVVNPSPARINREGWHTSIILEEGITEMVQYFTDLL